jgi:putative tryptophan/tyrosine transport system substrate-binding protein
VAVLTSGRPNAINIEQRNRRQTAAKALLIDLFEIPISEAAEVGEAFSKINQARVGAVLVSGTLWFVNAATVAARAIEQRLASITNLREFANAGALMTYGVSFAEIHRRSAAYFDRMIKGANPADMPVEQPTKFDLVINLRTAKSLGIEIPSKLLSTADEVIE